MRVAYSFAQRCVALTLVATLVGCSASVERSGYRTVHTRPAAGSPCEVAVRRAGDVPPGGKVVGKIEVGDTGFSTDCTEDNALEIMRKDACELGANVIEIMEESRPDAWSSCYRAEARFLLIQQVAGTPALATGTKYSPEKLQQRKQEDEDSSDAMIWGAVIGGIAAGIVAGLMTAANR